MHARWNRPLLVYSLTILLGLNCIASGIAESVRTLNISARGTDVHELLQAIATQYEVNVVPDSDVRGTVDVHLADAPFEEGLQSMLEANGLQFTKQGSIYRVHQLPQETGTLKVETDGEQVTIVADHADVRQVTQALGEQLGLNVSMDADVRGTVTVNLKDVDVDTAIQGVFSDQQYLLRRRGDVYHLAMRSTDTGAQQLIFYHDGEVSLELKEAPVADVLTDLAQQARLNVVFVGNRARSSSSAGLTLKLESIPLEDALDYVTSSAGLAYRKQLVRSGENTSDVYLVGDPTLQPGLDNPILEERIFWLKHIEAREVTNLLPRDIPSANVSVDEIRNAIVAVGPPRMHDRISRVLKELDIENDAIRSRLVGALAVEVSSEGRISIDAHEVHLVRALRELAVHTNIDITLLGETTTSVRTRSVSSEAPSTSSSAPALLPRNAMSPQSIVLNLRLQDASLDEAMQAVLAGTNYTFRRSTRGSRTHYLISPGTPRIAGSNPLLITRRIALKHLGVSEEEEFLALLPPTIPSDQVTFLPRQNAVAVVGTPEMVQEVEDYVRAIDLPAPQVMIEAILLEIHRGDSRELGISFGGERSEISVGVEQGIGVRFESLARAPQSFQASLQALLSENRARVLASPRVAVLNGQEATIRVGLESLFETVTEVLRGDEVPVGGVARQSFNSIQTGITLTLNPWIGADGEITLQIRPEIRDGTQITRESSTIAERSIDTQIRIPDGGLIAIGGLLQERETSVETGIPVLSHVPLLGGLFRDTSRQLSQTELIVVIQPKIMRPTGQYPSDDEER